MRAPLGARLEVPGRAPVDVSEILTDFTYRRGIPGDFLGASGKLWASPSDLNLTANSRLTITDGRTAAVLWQGYLDSPGDSFDETGEAFDLSCQGAMTLVGDQAEQLIYIDTMYDQWRSDDRNDENLAPSGEASASAWPDTEQDALMLQFASGTPISKGDEVRMVHDLADSCPMGIGGYSFKVKSGINTNGYECRVSLSTNGVVEAIDMQTSVQFMAGVLGVNIGTAGDILKIRLRRMAGATNVGSDRTWVGFADPYVVGNRWGRFGESQLSSGSLPNLTYVLASEVVEDLVARLMPMVDPNKVNIDTTSYHIDQLTYAEATRAPGVMEDLALFEPNFLWRVTPAGTSDGYGFDYVKWPTSPSYEISVADGYSAPGGEETQANRVAVTWVDRKGRERVEVVTRWVPALGGTPANPLADRVVDADKITLDESVSSLANAQRIGGQYLRLVNDPPKAATATVVRPIRDLEHGGMVAPWELAPGKVVRLRETGENLRLTEIENDTEACSASLQLGTPRPSLEQLIARLRKPRRRKR